MEINVKVSVEGVVRDVCGVNEATTCEEVIFKLAQAACLPGFYTLVAKHFSGETTLAPEEKLITFIRNLGEKPANVHFVLCRLEAHSMQTNCPTTATRPRVQQKPQQARVIRAPVAVKLEGQHQHKSPPHLKTGPGGSLSPATRPTATGSDSRPVTSAFTVDSSDDSASSTDQAQYAQLEDQLASQEHEVELNRIHLLQLDKAVESLDSHGKRMTVDSPPGSLAVGPAAELAQLLATPWSQLLEANRTRQLDLVRERDRYQLTVERLVGQLAKAQEEATTVENQVNQELQHLLANLESVNAHRRQLLRSLSPSSRPGSSRGRTLADKEVDGVAV